MLAHLLGQAIWVWMSRNQGCDGSLEGFGLSSFSFIHLSKLAKYLLKISEFVF